MFPAPLSSVLPPGRGWGGCCNLRVHVQSEIPQARHNSKSLFKIPYPLISPDAGEITTFFAVLLSNEKIFGSS